MSDPKNKADDQTVQQNAAETDHQIGAHEDEYVPVGGPRSGEGDTGTEDDGIDPEDEITPG